MSWEGTHHGRDRCPGRVQGCFPALLMVFCRELEPQRPPQAQIRRISSVRMDTPNIFLQKSSAEEFCGMDRTPSPVPGRLSRVPILA